MDIKNDAITTQEQDFAQWYTDVCKKAELMDYSSVKGFIIYRPYGYAIWEQIQSYLDKKFKAVGAYDAHEENSYERVKVLRALCQSYNPAIQMIQGETGTQSRSDGAGALKGGAWTPEKQAKYLARHMMSDFFSDVMFASYFSCMDMIEALNGTVGDKASYLDYG